MLNFTYMAAKKKKKKLITKMKSYESFDLWMKDQKTFHRGIIKPLRALVGSVSDKLQEAVKWGNGCWTLNDLPIVYLFAGYDGYVQLGFFAGSRLKDPKGKLEGNGKYVRFIKVHDKKEIDVTYSTKLIKQAMKIIYR